MLCNLCPIPFQYYGNKYVSIKLYTCTFYHICKDTEIGIIKIGIIKIAMLKIKGRVWLLSFYIESNRPSSMSSICF